jgi:hypothetical protein
MYLWYSKRRADSDQLRVNAPEVEGTVIDLNDLSSWLRPALHVHVGECCSE